MIKALTKVIIIPGLSDKVPSFIENFADDSIEIEPFHTGWRRNVINSNWSAYYDTVIWAINTRIDEAFEAGKRVVLIGTSAGASVAINAFYGRRNRVAGVINIAGRLSTAEGPTLKSFEEYRHEEPIFVESVKRAELILAERSSEFKEKFTAFVPLYDELVPPSSMFFEGARVKRLLMVEHMLNIGMAFTFHKKTLLKVIQGEE